MSRTSNRLFLLGLIVAAAMLAIVPARSTPAGDREDDIAGRLETLEREMKELARIVNQDPMYPKRPLTARVDALETAFEKFEKAGQVSARTGQREWDELDKRLDQQARSTDGLARRVAEIEKASSGTSSGMQRELQSQARQIDQLENAVASLKQRVDRLESRR